MRKDMSKVIVERPRRGHGASYVRGGKTVALEDDDGVPLRARAPKRTLPVKSKELNENLAPLKRFLEGQVGRPWNKVYAEISEHLKATNTVQQHVRDHVEDFVAVKTRMERGKVVTVMRYGGVRTLEDSYFKLYVHPRTGLLRKNAHWKTWSAARKARAKAEEAARAARMREVSPLVQLHRLKDGVWWEVTLAKIKVHARPEQGAAGRMVTRYYQEPYADVVWRAKLSDLPAEELYGRAGVYAAEKRQLNKAEKKKLGLS